MLRHKNKEADALATKALLGGTSGTCAGRCDDLADDACMQGNQDTAEPIPKRHVFYNVGVLFLTSCKGEARCTSYSISIGVSISISVSILQRLRWGTCRMCCNPRGG